MQWRAFAGLAVTDGVLFGRDFSVDPLRFLFPTPVATPSGSDPSQTFTLPLDPAAEPIAGLGA